MSTAVVTKRKYRMGARAEAASATRERVLSVAWEQFASKRYEDVRIADIAAAAAVTPPTVYSGFGPKDDLFVAAWKWAIGPEGARRDAAPVGDARAAVHLIYDSYELQGDAVLRLLAQEERIAAVHEMAEAGRAWHRSWVERTFAPLLKELSGAARKRRLVALTVATDLLVWKLLRREMGLGRLEAERVVIEMIVARRSVP
jgi:AcrR family transcriptional regulator